MANYSTLKAAVADVVKTNGTQAITGANLQTILLSIINSIGGGGYIFNGVATPSTNAGTPDQNVFYIGGTGTYANFGTSVVVPPTNIAVFKYNGTWTCEQVTVENGGVFDISAFKAIGGTLATYADLAAALGTGGANVPEGVRKGGMSIKYVQSSDNKYVQYRLMSESFSTDTNDWSFCGDVIIVDNQTFIEVKTDAEGKLLETRKPDGTITEYCDLEVKGSIINEGLQNKVDKITGQSLIDADFAISQKSANIQEWLQVTTDSQDKILEGIKQDGSKVIYSEVDNIQLSQRCKIILQNELGIDGKINIPDSYANNNIVLFDNNGNVKDSGYNINNIPSSHIPTGGHSGEVLTNDGDDNYYWSDVPRVTTTDVSQTFGVLVDQYESENTGLSWTPAIRKAVSEAGEGGSIVFTPGKTYNIDNIIYMQKGQMIVGNGATIKRMNESVAVVASNIAIGDDNVEFENIPDDWLPFITDYGENSGGHFYFYNDNGGAQGIYIVHAKIVQNSKSGNSIRFRDIETMVGSAQSTFPVAIPAGTKVLRSYNLFSGGQTDPNPYKVFNLIFDGNKSNNDNIHNWGINNTLHIFGRGSVVEFCKFINIPNENIVTQGSWIINCYAKNLNGGFVHLSFPPDSHLAPGVEKYEGTFVIGNYCENIMIDDESVLGHNIAPVTYSWNPGRLVVIGNQFYGNKTSKCILMDATTPSDQIGTTEGGDMRRAIYIGNLYENFQKIGDIPIVSSNTTRISTRLITNNIFKDCGTSDMKRLYQTDLMFENNLYDGDTIVDTGGNSKIYRIDTEISSTPTASALTTKYVNLPIGGEVYIVQINKLYKKILSGASTVAWTEENISILN